MLTDELAEAIADIANRTRAEMASVIATSIQTRGQTLGIRREVIRQLLEGIARDVEANLETFTTEVCLDAFGDLVPQE